MELGGRFNSLHLAVRTGSEAGQPVDFGRHFFIDSCTSLEVDYGRVLSSTAGFEVSLSLCKVVSVSFKVFFLFSE